MKFRKNGELLLELIWFQTDKFQDTEQFSIDSNNTEILYGRTTSVIQNQPVKTILYGLYVMVKDTETEIIENLFDEFSTLG